ncbi:MAG: RidA family protein [Spirochaetaceae bacterium]|jgi:2-iminobutanoate/2-iminopropanoate deaminase|nr:RidA family protein [Spirochaetaceae bacterium]
MKTCINTEKAPAAIGPYSQGVSATPFVWTSGQLPIDMKTGELEIRDIKKATKNSIENCRSVLEAAGLGLANVVKTTVFMTNLNDFAAMNAVYSEYFAENAPARSCVQVAALPKGAPIEIEMIAG